MALLAVATLLLWLPRRAWSEPYLEMLVAISPLGTAAAVAAVGVSAVRRRAGALLLALLVLAGHLQAHELLDRGWARPATAADLGVGLRIVSANLLAGNDHLPRALDRVASSDADIILLQEVDAATVSACWSGRRWPVGTPTACSTHALATSGRPSSPPVRSPAPGSSGSPGGH